jgi:hypothetical protein
MFSPPADGAAGRALPLLAHALLDGDLDRVVELAAAAGEELDAVVGHRVVAGREHHAEVDAEALGQVGDTGRGQHVEEEHVHARGRQAGDHGCLEELAGDAGVAAHHGPGPVALELPAVGEHVGCCDREVEGQLGGQRDVGEAADTVGAEETRHGPAAYGERVARGISGTGHRRNGTGPGPS